MRSDKLALVIPALNEEAALHRLLAEIPLIEPLFDVDELPDLLRLAQVLEADSTRAPTTAAYLATIKELV